MRTNELVKYCILLLIVSMLTVLAAPEGPTGVEVINSTTGPINPADQLDAIAGNITILNIDGSTTTRTWQGYVGNVSGNLSLDDASGNSLYYWEVASPEGEIYASTAQIDFSDGNIECYNFTHSGGSYLDLAAFETTLGLESDDADGVNETFNETTNYDTFYAGTNLINTHCPTTYLLNSTGEQNQNQFQEVLLYDLTADAVIYTALLENNLEGFDTLPWDFQLIVGEDGHDADTSTTTYYFYVEIE